MLCLPVGGERRGDKMVERERRGILFLHLPYFLRLKEKRGDEWLKRRGGPCLHCGTPVCRALLSHSMNAASPDEG